LPPAKPAATTEKLRKGRLGDQSDRAKDIGPRAGGDGACETGGMRFTASAANAGPAELEDTGELGRQRIWLPAHRSLA
jgi:hypothetical protein